VHNSMGRTILLQKLYIRLLVKTEAARVSDEVKAMITMLDCLCSLMEALRYHPVKVLWPVQCFASDDSSFAACYFSWQTKLRPSLESDDDHILQYLRALRPAVPISPTRGTGYETYLRENAEQQERLVDFVRQQYIDSFATSCYPIDVDLQDLTEWLAPAYCRATNLLPRSRRRTAPPLSSPIVEPHGRSLSTSDLPHLTWSQGVSPTEQPRRHIQQPPRARERHRRNLMLESGLAAMTVAEARENQGDLLEEALQDETPEPIAEEVGIAPIMLDGDTYRLIPHLWSSATPVEGHVSLADLVDFMDSQGFRYTEAEGSRVKFRRVGLDGNEQSVLLHTPHPNPHFQHYQIRDVGSNMTRFLGWNVATFVEGNS
jgi:hypothetical protein